MKPPRTVVLFVLLLVSPSVKADDSKRVEMFPDSHHLFARLLADPRQSQTSASYYRLGGKDTADVALGNSWGMKRWEHLGRGGDWDVQWDIEGMGLSRFLLSGAVNEFQTIDFFANVPVEIRHGKWSARATLFHESSHLGDDYFRRTGDKGSRYSVEGFRAMFAYEPWSVLRLYGGGTELIHTIPSLEKGTLQAGFEAKTPDLRWLPHPCWIYLAQDVQSKQDAKWNINSNTELGFQIGFPGGLRSMRVHVDYYTGHSQFAQFRTRKESFFKIGSSFDF